jgi:hypothetical protein
MIPAGKKARYTIPPFNPFALLSSNPWAVFVHTEHPWAHAPDVTNTVIATATTIFFTRKLSLFDLLM